MAAMADVWEWNILEGLKEMSLMSIGKNIRWNAWNAMGLQNFMAMAKLTQLVLRGE
jgi:hypothetical protein